MLFRREVMVARARSLEGEVALAAPLPWRLGAALLLALASLGIAWLLLGRGAERRTIVTRALPDGTLRAIIPPPALAPGACGTAIIDGSRMKLCMLNPGGPSAVSSDARGRLTLTQTVTLRTPLPVAPGTRVPVTFAGPSRPLLDLLW